MNLTPLFDAARGPLARWLTSTRREVVDLRASSAERRYMAAVVIWTKLADEWANKAEAMPGSDRIHWDTISRDDLSYVLSDIMDEYGPRMDRNYPMSAEGRLDILEAWARKRATSEAGMVELWTDAPPDYDHGYTRRTGEMFQSALLRKPLYRVLIPQQYVETQAARYSSGLHAAYDTARMAQERKYSAESNRRAEFIVELKRLQAKLDKLPDMIPAKRDQGTWYSGVGQEYKHTADGRGYWGSKEIPYESLNPQLAALEAAEIAADFAKLPEDIRKLEWRIGADAEDLGRIALATSKRLQGEASERARAAAEEKKRRDKAVRETVEFWESKYAPILGKLVEVEDRSGTSREPTIRGLVTSWPPVNGVFQTETGPIDVELGRVYEDIDGRGRRYGQKSMVIFSPAPSTHVPLAVWKAGAPRDVEINFMPDGAPVFSWRPFGAYEKKVVNADGRTMGKNTMAYAVASKAATTGNESQDAALDRNVSELIQALGHPEPGHAYPVLLKTRKGEPLLNVGVIPPAGGKGLVGYIVFTRQVIDDKVYRNAWIREARATKERPYLWRVIEDHTLLPAETLYLNRTPNHEKAEALFKNEPTEQIPPLALAKVLKPGDEVKLNDGAVPWQVTRAKFGEVTLSNGTSEYSMGEDGVERGTLTFAGPRGAVRVDKLLIVKEAP